jgi:hypothetical protein
MPDIHPALPILPFTYEQWTQRTSRLMAQRSDQLKALDRCLESYIRVPNASSLNFLKTAFRVWTVSKGPGDAWKQSSRNDKGTLPFIGLHAALYGKGDTDAALNVPSFMSGDTISARKGLLYLFGHVECEPNYFQIVTGGVLDLVGAGLGFAGDKTGGAANKGIGIAQEVLGYTRPGFDSAAEKMDQRIDANRPAQAPGSLKVGPDDVAQQRIVDASLLLNRQPASLTPERKQLSDMIYDQFERSWRQVMDFWDNQAGGMLRHLCDSLTSRFLSSAVNSIIGGSFGVVSKLIPLVESCFERYRMWATGKKTTVLTGSPTAIVDGIKRGMDLALAENLYATLKSGAQLGMQIASVGASSIINLVTSIIEVLIKTAWRLYEIAQMRKFFGEARTKWLQRETDRLYEHPIAFNSWFRGYAVNVPMIAALSLNSNLCHSMHFLQMFQTGREPVTQAQYDDGMTHMAHIKRWSSRYIEECGYRLSSGDPLVGEWIKPTQVYESGVRKHLVAPALAFLGGD